MRITADATVLVRFVVADHPDQAAAAAALLERAEAFVLTVPVLCELTRVLRSVYGIARADIADTVAVLIDAATAVVRDRAAVEAGIRALREGDDFADAAIAMLGAGDGATLFASFDRRALALASRLGLDAAAPEVIFGRGGGR
ncbi:MAG: PIN domain-containing protein [Rhodospirillales bacterium]